MRATMVARSSLTPRLAAYTGVTRSGLIVGAIWAAWHYPILLGADYNAGTPPLYAVTCFTIMVVSMAVVLSWLRAISDSIWPCVLVHAAHNTLVQGTLDPMTTHSGTSVYVTTEFGWGMALTLSVAAIVAVIQGRRRGGIV